MEEMGLMGTESRRGNYLLKGTALLTAVCLLFAFTSTRLSTTQLATPTMFNAPLSSADDPVRSGKYTLKNYDSLPPFSSFLPAIAGEFGVPLWSFYVNRGQGISSFGLKNKDTPIMEFDTANKAYQTTPFSGFRTFIKVKRNGKDWLLYEPFQTRSEDVTEPPREMKVSLNQLELSEVNSELGLKTDVYYYILAHEDFPALVRGTTVTNTGAHDITVEVTDGLVKMEPFGVTDDALKKMGRTLEGFMGVYNLDKNPSVALYHLQTGIGDTEEVVTYTEGNFAMAFVEEDSQSTASLPLIVDPNLVFGFETTLLTPSTEFKQKSLEELLSRRQANTSRTPSAMTGGRFTITAGKSVTIFMIYGHAKSQVQIDSHILPIVSKNGYFREKREAAIALGDEITAPVKTSSGLPLFDGYIRQAFLDNCLRGGFPKLLGNPDQPKVYHIYSRLHGDIERDYNYFIIESFPYSQGPGNFRDVNQNRRSDVMWNPKIGDFNIKTFVSLIQADGYNPLTVQSASFRLPGDRLDEIAAQAVGEGPQRETLKSFLSGNIIPGILLSKIIDSKINLVMDKEKFINLVTDIAEENVEASYSQGFWSDHWTYTLDQVVSYLTVFPDKKSWLLFESGPYPFFISPATVAPRSRKYVNANGVPHQYDTVYWDWDKQNSINAHGDGTDRNWQHERQSWGVFKLPLISKLVFLASIKFVSLDPWGMGVEMEAGKPGWLDALNGLPGLFGSGMAETYELLHLLNFIKEAMAIDRPVPLHNELHRLLATVLAQMDIFDKDSDDLRYWNAVEDAKEGYREATRTTFEGITVVWASWDVLGAVNRMIAKVEKGIKRAVDLNDQDGIPPTYFTWELVSYDYLGPGDWQGRPFIRATSWKPHPLPLFLEGPVRALKVVNSLEDRRALYQAVRSSALYDSELRMYKISASLASQPLQLGRVKAFGPGWLENESIWLHMSYKYYLELLRGGLFTEFWKEARTGLTMFMDPKVYGRSPLEASSFIVSSAHPDDHMHGYGVAARLSGSTAEFISMWFILMAGQTPFYMDGTDLKLRFKPCVPGWLFDEAGQLSFRFLGRTMVTYHNPERADTWTVNPVRVVVQAGGKEIESNGPILGDISKDIRDGKVDRVHVYFK